MDRGSIIVIVLGLTIVAAVAVFAFSRRGSQQPVMLPPATTYNNLEVWQISWNAEGLPEKIEVHREAKQSVS